VIADYWEGMMGEAGPRVALDLRWMNIPPDIDTHLALPLARAWRDLEATERGDVVNLDERRRVGHFWLRAPELAPDHLGDAIRDAWRATQDTVTRLAERFTKVLVIGIGGSALGPQLVAHALSHPGDLRAVYFMDNTDPDGMDQVLRAAAPLHEVLVLVISKSGGTPETRNGYLVAKAVFAEQGLDFAQQAIAITQEGSALHAEAHNWLARLPMWDWVGGRTSVTSVVGLLPAALQGIDTDAFLAGARAMDEATRGHVVSENPAALMALAWYSAGGGKGDKALVVLPYKDRLILLSRYLQQLVMESLGKRHDRAGHHVHQGLSVFGNKGSTDQHAFVQQLRDGRADFFVTFIEVLEDGPPDSLATRLEVEPGVAAGDYLSCFLAGTRQALSHEGRASLTLTVPWIDAKVLGAVIALFERTVSIYASLIDVNAYHQPGVEAGKKAAARLLGLQQRLFELLAQGDSGTAEAFAERIGADQREVFHLLRHAAANGRIEAEGEGLARVFSAVKD
jgi:glucose-6-phosphate isomerase